MAIGKCPLTASNSCARFNRNIRRPFQQDDSEPKMSQKPGEPKYWAGYCLFSAVF